MKKTLLVIVSILLVACQSDVVYTNFVSLPTNGWHSDSTLCFNAEITDSISDWNYR